MFQIRYDKPACQNLRESLRKEWLETDGLGGYASSTIPCCNTRKYHGLYVPFLADPGGRHVLLAAVEESLTGDGKEFFLSCRKHPGVYHPRGHEHLFSMEQALWPVFRYVIGRLILTREIMMPQGQSMTLVRYTLEHDSETAPDLDLTLVVKPLLAYRHFHALTRENAALNTAVQWHDHGLTASPYQGMPDLHIWLSATCMTYPAPDWVRTVQYLVEEERGFAFAEDLFLPGSFTVPLAYARPVILAASMQPPAEPLEAIWEAEARRREQREASRLAASGIRVQDRPDIESTGWASASGEPSSLIGHLSERADDFLITSPHGDPQVIAGYPWFDAWGRDACIALPGLTLWAGQPQTGLRHLIWLGEQARGGLIPNCFAADGENHAYNSVDASLWYVWAVQQFDLAGVCPDAIREHCWPAIKRIIDAFMSGPLPTVFVDNAGLLHAGSEDTQLTWMDATVHGRPVTPRHGCPVEINALWYNALVYADQLSRRYDRTGRSEPELFDTMRGAFLDRFWVRRRDGGYLADVWRDGQADAGIRPNQLFAVALPHPILEEPERQRAVLDTVTANLLTPYGLRTLSPDDAAYRAVYFGSGEARDGAYHQGTVWTWPLGIYADALLKLSLDPARDAARLLDTLTPLFARHLTRAGIGTISEVFDGSPPHYPNGCIAQAWSVAECIRLLKRLQAAAPEAFAAWESTHFAPQLLGEKRKSLHGLDETLSRPPWGMKNSEG